ncbi:MAG: DUF58 domain-containing protein [Christensenellales bacterium]
MSARLFAAVCALIVSGLCALSLGGRVFYLVSWALLMMILYALASVLLARALMRVSQEALDRKAERGGSSRLAIRLRLLSPLPLGGLTLHLQLPDGRGRVPLSPPVLKEVTAAFPFHLPHVGVVPVGLSRLVVSDLFGFFHLRVPGLQPPAEVCVLPRPFDVEQLKFLKRDEGRALPGRSSEDITSPEDTRLYRQGDAMKRIHWKLSSRRRELIVRRFEVPEPPDTLILMDCSDPQGFQGAPDGLGRMKDTLCETALSVAKMQMQGGHPVRLPLYGARTGEFHADRSGSLSLLQEELAYQIFRGGEPFDRVLAVELRRMRRTGATVVITSRLDAAVVEGVKHIRLSGPSVRFYLVTFLPEEERLLGLVQQLQHHRVEVCYVTPA